MVARVLRLRLALFAGSLRGTRWETARRIIGLVLLAALVAAACVGLLSLRSGEIDVAAAVLVLVGAATLLGFAVGPLLVSTPDQLDPRRFAVLGLEPGPLAATLTLASLVSVPSIALVAVDICAAVVWIGFGVNPLVAALFGVVHVVTCVVVARVALAFTAALTGGRRTRELSSLFVLGLIVIVFPVTVFLASLTWDGRVPDQIRSVVDVLSLSPLGAAAGVPGTIALPGSTGWVAAAVAVATCAVVVAVWVRQVTRALSTVENPVELRQRGGLGWFALAPGNAAGAVAARSIVYWFSDMRYMANLAVIPIAGLLPVLPLLIAGVPGSVAALVPIPIMALFFGWVAHNDTAYDSSAVWIHIVTGVGGIADRIGRTIPVLLTAIPLLAVAVPIAMAFHGDWALLPALVGTAAALFLCGLGLSSVSSALAPYPVPTPGDSPFRQPQRTGSIGVWSQALVMGGALVLSAPTLWFAWLALVDDVDDAMTAQWTGLGTGVLVLALGVLLGGALFQRRESRIMEFAATT
ncbi:MAG: hypothetical protein ACTHZX_01250 [Microbacterium sp.]